MHFCATDDFTASEQTGFCSPWIFLLFPTDRERTTGPDVCPEWTWPADELIHTARCPSASSVPASSAALHGSWHDHVRTRERGHPSAATATRPLQDHMITLAKSAGFNLDDNRETTEEPTGYPSVTAEGLGAAAKTMGAAHRSAVAEIKQVKINLRRCKRDASAERWPLATRDVARFSWIRTLRYSTSP